MENKTYEISAEENLNPFEAGRFPLVSAEEMREAGVLRDFQQDPTGFEVELKSEAHKRRGEIDTVLKPRYNWFPRVDYANAEPIESAGEIVDFRDDAERDAADRFLATTRGSEKKQKLMYLLNQVKKSGRKLSIKPTYDELELLSKAYEGIETEKDLYIAGRLYEKGIFLHFSRSKDAKEFFDEFHDFDLFEAVLSVSDQLQPGPYTFDIIRCYSALQNFGRGFLDVILAASKKLEQIKKQPILRDYIESTSGIEDISVADSLESNPYLCQSIANLSLDSVSHAIDILGRINAMQNEQQSRMDFPSFVYFADLVGKHKEKLEKIEFDADFAERNNLKHESPAEIILYLIYTPERLPILKDDRNEYKYKVKKEAAEKYVEAEMPFLENLAEYYGIKNRLRIVDNSSREIFQNAHIESASLKFLAEHPQHKEFIRDNFEVKDFDQLTRITKLILDSGSDQAFEAKLAATKNLEKTILSSATKKVSEIFFLSEAAECEPDFINWLAELYLKTGFSILTVFSNSYPQQKISKIKEWYLHQEDFTLAVQMGILGGEEDDLSREFSSNIYEYKAIAEMLHNPQLLEFLKQNSGITLMRVSIKNARDGEKSIAQYWYENQEIFEEAKALGFFASESQSAFRNDNLINYAVVTEIVSDKDFVRFLQENNLLQEVINLAKRSGRIESIFSWYRDPEAFLAAKQIGLFDDEIRSSIIYQYEQLSVIGKLGEEQISQLKDIFHGNIPHYFLVGNLREIISQSAENKKSIYLNTFIRCLEAGKLDSQDTGFAITKENFCDFLGDGESLITVEKDRGLIKDPVPWSKEWFAEDANRFSYLNSDIIQTFKKFGTVITLAILEGAKDIANFKEFYSDTTKRINRENERSTMLQLGEIFSLIISKGNFDLFDQLVGNEFPIGKTIQDFVERYGIGDKGKTIVTLLFAREVNTAHQSGLDQNIEVIIKAVYEKLKKYEAVISAYGKENIPAGLRTSIGMEYEVTSSIAKGYLERTASDYKADIETLSCYSGIAKGNDAIHEIATRPTDNPYLLLLEMKLLNDLDFVDLNFEHPDYEKGSRSFHITLGGEYGISCDANANFIQNTLVAADLGGINTGNLVGRVNNYSNIRDKGGDCEAIFGREKTPVTEYRSLAIDRAEPFERCVITIFNLNMAKQALEKHTSISEKEMGNFSEAQNLEDFQNMCEKNKFIKGEITDPKIWNLIFAFVQLQNRVINAASNHDAHFFDNETLGDNASPELYMLMSGLVDGGKEGKRLASRSIDWDFSDMQDLSTSFPLSEEAFYEQLQSMGKIKQSDLSDKNKHLVYLWFKKYIAEPMQAIKNQNSELFAKLKHYFSEGNPAENIYTKIQNQQRFESVIQSDVAANASSMREYAASIQIPPADFYSQITPNFVNALTRIHNLFLKPPTTGTSADSVNAVSVLESTKEDRGVESDVDATKRTVFDCIDQGKSVRNGIYTIQGSSEKMLINSIQKALLDFNDQIKSLLSETSKDFS